MNAGKFHIAVQNLRFVAVQTLRAFSSTASASAATHREPHKMSLVRALGCCAATSLAVAYARSNDMYAKTEASSVDVPKSVELRCSPISPACSRARVFFQQINADVKHVGTSPLSNSISAVVDGQQVSNVTELVDQLRAATAKTSVFAPAEAVEEKRWCSWTEDKLLPIINVNVFRSPKEAKVVMGVAIKKSDMNVVNRTFVYQAGSWYKYFAAKSLKRKLKLEDDRIALVSLVEEWVAAVGSRGLMGGAAPNKADLAVYGALNSIEGLDAFEEIICQTGVGAWYQRVSSYRAPVAPVKPV